MTNKKLTFPSLSNPPAMEVILGVGVEDDENFDIGQLDITETDFRNRFPTQETFTEITGVIDAKSEEITNTKRLLGYIYKADNEEASHFRTNGFTYSKLGNYPGGQTFFKNAKEIWNIYETKRQNFNINDLALRYINVITVTDFNYNYKDFFHTFLQTPDNIGKINTFRYQYKKRFEEQNCEAKVTLRLETIKKESLEAKFLFDIDVKKNNVPPKLTEEQISNFFEEMRYCKNVIFFSTLSKKIIGQYK